MIRGFFSDEGGRRRPFVTISVTFPTLGLVGLPFDFLVDTGADRSVLSPGDATRLGYALTALPSGPSTRGVGGLVQTRSLSATLTMGEVSIDLMLVIFLPTRDRQTMPSLLGRDVLSHFALFLEERTQRVLLLDPAEADRLTLA